MKAVVLICSLLLVSILSMIIYFTSETTVTKQLDSHIYSLPYKPGSSHKIVQGYGGRFSHTEKAALDFEMPEGTPIYAARGGKVKSYKDNSDEGGIFTSETKSNYILIQHSDGSIGCYYHLKKNGVLTKSGNVRQGQLIGYSGKTGFALQPHLHFAVKKILNYKKHSYVRTKFNTSNGIMLLRNGVIYKNPE